MSEVIQMTAKPKDKPTKLNEPKFQQSELSKHLQRLREAAKGKPAT